MPLCMCVSFATRPFGVRARVYVCLSINCIAVCVSVKLAAVPISVARKLKFVLNFLFVFAKMQLN